MELSVKKGRIIRNIAWNLRISLKLHPKQNMAYHNDIPVDKRGWSTSETQGALLWYNASELEFAMGLV